MDNSTGEIMQGSGPNVRFSYSQTNKAHILVAMLCDIISASSTFYLMISPVPINTSAVPLLKKLISNNNMQC